MSAGDATAQTCDQAGDIDRAVCLTNQAVLTGDVTYCEDISGSMTERGQCLSYFARMSGEAYCDTIEGEFERDNCYNQGRVGRSERAARDAARARLDSEQAVQQEQLQVLEDQLRGQEEAQERMADLIERQNELIEAQNQMQEDAALEALSPAQQDTAPEAGAPEASDEMEPEAGAPEAPDELEPTDEALAEPE